uniref:AMIN domain-containing protein n=1 Tax=Elaeophora elaphi TaxID=1147741 RepID=A0A0R3RWA4_9BILA
MTYEEKQLGGGIRNVRIHIPINGSHIIDFGFDVRNAIAFFPKSDEFNDRLMTLIRNGRLVREGIKFYEGRAYYSRGKFRIQNFQERDTTVLLLEGPNGAPQKYSIEVAKN